MGFNVLFKIHWLPSPNAFLCVENDLSMQKSKPASSGMCQIQAALTEHQEILAKRPNGGMKTLFPIQPPFPGSAPRTGPVE
jgi:hypothetical protein